MSDPLRPQEWLQIPVVIMEMWNLIITDHEISADGALQRISDTTGLSPSAINECLNSFHDAGEETDA